MRRCVCPPSRTYYYMGASDHLPACACAPPLISSSPSVAAAAAATHAVCSLRAVDTFASLPSAVAVTARRIQDYDGDATYRIRRPTMNKTAEAAATAMLRNGCSSLAFHPIPLGYLSYRCWRRRCVFLSVWRTFRGMTLTNETPSRGRLWLFPSLIESFELSDSFFHVTQIC